MQIPEARATLEALAERLTAIPPTFVDIAKALGARVAPGQSEAGARWDRPPFLEVAIDEFETTVNLSVTLTGGTWLLADLAAEPSAFKLAPRLPDSGALEAARTWEGPQSHVTWIVRVGEGDGSLATRRVQGKVRGQIIPR